MVQRIRELVVYASNDTQDQASTTATQGDRRKIQDEIDQLAKEIDSMANRVEFNKKKLINGSFAGGSETDRQAYLDAAKKLNDSRQSLIDFVGGASTFTPASSSSVNTWTELLSSARSVAAQLEAKYQSDVESGQATPKGMSDATKEIETIISRFEEMVSKELSAGDLSEFNHSGGTIGSDLVQLKTDATTLLSAMNSSVSSGAADLLSAVSALGADFNAAMGSSIGSTNTAVVSGRTDWNALSHNLSVLTEDYITAKTTVEKSSQPGLYFQVGANANQALEMSIGSVKTDMLGIGDGYGNSLIDVMKTTGKGITYQLDVLDSALTYVTTQRSKLGAAQNRLEYTMNSLDISTENLTAAESRIRDVDLAKEMTNFTRQSILFQASTAMLAQANAFPQGVLQLLG
jgi:flagellin